MKPLRLVGAALLAAHLGGAHAAADAPQATIKQIALSELALNDIPAFPGVSAAFIEGAFDKPGLYVAHSKMAEGAVFPPHAHPDVRLTVVTSGVMYLGQGEAFDESKLVAYPVGTVAVTPPGVYHFMAAKDGAATVLEIGSGPSGSSFATN